MKDGLYHKELGLPEAALARWVGRTFRLSYSRHAMQAALNDRYGRLVRAPSELTLDLASVFEVEVVRGRVVKFVVRIGAGFQANRPGLDLILVLSEDLRGTPGTLFVRTVWFNEKTDGHSTLDASKYVALAA